MSPRFELNFFMNPMGMGGFIPFSPFCGGMGFGSCMPSLFCGSNFMTMPYSDTLSFMNTPVFRNTSYDYLLDPNLALSQCRQQWAQGGGYGGSTMLPGFQFPQWGPIQSPWAPKVETEEEKKAREEKEKKKTEEGKKPEHTKAQNLEKLFNEIKKISTDDNGLEAITKEQEDAVKEAMKKETAKERYDAMKEVFEGIEPSTIKKAILNNENIRKDLRKAGYNFDKSENSLKNPDINEENCDHKKQVEKIYESIKNHKSAGFSDKYNELMKLAGTATDGNILSYISAWNDKYHSDKDRSVLRWIASNLPDSTEVTAMQEVIPKDIILITQGLLDKAKEYDEKGCTDVDKAAKELDKQLKEIFGNDLDKAKVTDFNNSFKQKINQLAEKFDKLYVALRIREAVKVRDNIAKKEEYSFLNEVKEGIINDNLIVAETIKDLKAEGFEDSQIPEVAKLSKPKKTSEEQAAARRESKKADKELDTAEEKLNHLVEQELLTPLVSEDDVTVDDNKIGVYKTAGLDDNGKDARYFKIVDDTLVEVTKNSEGKFEPVEEEADDSKVIEEITNYTQAINRAKDLIASGAIVDYRTSVTHSQCPIFKASGANQFFIIKDNQLYEIKNCTGINEQAQGDGKFAIHAVGTEKTLEQLEADDLIEVDSDYSLDNIKSKKKMEEQKREADTKENAKRAEKITKDEYTYKNLDSQAKQAGLTPTGVIGYYKLEETGKQTLYFKYNVETSKFIYLKAVTDISPWGIATVNGKKQYLQEVQSASDSAKDLYKILKNTDDNNDLNAIKRKMASFRRYTKASDVVDFLKTYENEASGIIVSNRSIGSAIVKNKSIPEADKKQFISLIALRIIRIMPLLKLEFNDNDDKVILQKIADGKLVSNNQAEISPTLESTAQELDRIMKLFLEKYDEKYN